MYCEHFCIIYYDTSIPVYREEGTQTKQGGGRYSTTPIP